MGEQRVLLVALAASAGQQLILAVAAHKWVAFLAISLGSLGERRGGWSGARSVTGWRRMWEADGDGGELLHAA